MASRYDQASTSQGWLAPFTLPYSHVFVKLSGQKVGDPVYSSYTWSRILIASFSNLSQARLGTLEEDLDMEGTDYNLATSILFIGYLLMQLPSNLLLTRVRPSLFLGIAMAIWYDIFQWDRQALECLIYFTGVWFPLARQRFSHFPDSLRRGSSSDLSRRLFSQVPSC